MSNGLPERIERMAGSEERMGRTMTARSMEQAREMVRRADDGDTIRLAWPGACKATCQAVESMAIGLGLDVVVEVGQRIAGTD